MDASSVEIEVLDRLALPSGAQDDAERRVLGGLALVPIEPPQVQLHLPRVGRLEVADLELDGDQPLHRPMKEQQVEVVVVAVERDALLPLDEREARPQLEEEALDLAQD